MQCPLQRTNASNNRRGYVGFGTGNNTCSKSGSIHTMIGQQHQIGVQTPYMLLRRRPARQQVKIVSSMAQFGPGFQWLLPMAQTIERGHKEREAGRDSNGLLDSGLT